MKEYLVKTMAPAEYKNPATNPGDPNKILYKLDSKKNILVEVGKMNLQEYIDSFHADTNYKQIIEDLHTSNDNFDRVSEMFPMRPEAQYLDVTKVELEVLGNLRLANELYLDLERQDLEIQENMKKLEDSKKEVLE